MPRATRRRAVTLTLSDRAPAGLGVDALLVTVAATPDGPALVEGHGLPRDAAEHLRAAIADLGVTGRAEEVTRLARVPALAATRVVLVGLGDGTGRRVAPEALRRGLGAAVRTLGGTAKAAVCVPGATAVVVAAAAEGVGLGAYAVPRVTGSGSAPTPVAAVTLLTPTARRALVRRAVKRAVALTDGVAWCRDLVNAPPNLLYPETFADEVKERFAGTGVTVKVLDEKQLARGGYGGIVGVGQGSIRPPRLVTLTWTPPGAPRTLAHFPDVTVPFRRVALVGKGITFDSGGLSIKPRASMPAMKSDMSGAAAVAGVMLAVAALQLPVAVTAYLALAENMPGGNAQRAGDVVTMRGGMTVEILDPDAEGRMVLGDAMALASEQHPDALVDIATLTGAQVLALGRIGAVMGNDDGFRSTVCRAADDAGEELWPMPLPGHLRAGLDTPFADIAHKGDANGGMLTAGLFLREFVGTTSQGGPIPWAHLDIAGPAYNTGAPWAYVPKGGTGYGVRTLLALLEEIAR